MVTSHSDWQSRIAEAREQLTQAFADAEEAWGPTDGLHAHPQAVQLEFRIQEGKRYLQEHPKDAKARRLLVGLKNRLMEMREDREDQERCKAWHEAYRRYLGWLDHYLRLVRLYGEEGEDE